jgi:hypothetical protein
MMLLGVVLAALPVSSVIAQSEAERGAVGGGVAGAVIGGIIGHQNDETAEGALIGGAVGAIAGGLLGQERDRQNYRDYQYQQYQLARYNAGVSFQDVIVMSQSGVSPSVIINQIYANGVQQRPGVNDIVALHHQGVAEPVIDAMQRARLATALPPVVHRPVVVEHYYEPRPVYVYPHCHGHHFHYDFHFDRHHRH